MFQILHAVGRVILSNLRINKEIMCDKYLYLFLTYLHYITHASCLYIQEGLKGQKFDKKF